MLLEENSLFWKVLPFLENKFTVAIVSSCVCLFLLICIWVLYVKRHYSPVRSKILIVGRSGEDEQPGSGKSTLYHVLRTGKAPKFQSVTSMVPNEGTFIPRGSKTLKEANFVDFPGNERLKTELEDQVLHAKVIIYVLDVSRLETEIRKEAISVYNIFKLLKKRNRKAIPILIFCNKIDLCESFPLDKVRQILGEEILKYQREVAPSGGDESVLATNIDSLLACSQYVVSFESGSAAQGVVEPVIHFLDRI
ncbi:hypothetical protein Gasu2_55260 [Galdieria sulphuraria]|uniref:Signal recognition particle receptor subunit beta n=1 Tax=Galdieria sulphuraria TaxID=130081 RepID=M2W0V4_GALSU|nr:signal recognition particle receptor subunit beta [Galdieria sulphuraria]EME29241.1 signal recognition particle receptor subunit beta [Galdieria sulphuraria]GJD11386.1 hypothetical protein Gasu2_55260 [Galdieria sulphuraria]|eukprot:XP_005705761.1 signal recognition particle receptor subunit beta [Galdieria sulphuraria]